MKNDQIRVALDLNELWESGTADGSRLVTGVAVVRKGIPGKASQEVEAFMEAYKKSGGFCQ